MREDGVRLRGLGHCPAAGPPEEKVTRMELSIRFMLHIRRHENRSEKVQSQTFTVG